MADEKKSDVELAKNVRNLVALLQKAVKEAFNSGLHVTVNFRAAEEELSSYKLTSTATVTVTKTL